MSKNIAVVYRSKSGFTKNYAEWIADALKADLFEGQNVTVDGLMEYDIIIYGGGLYAGGINGIKLIKNNFDKLKDKEIFVFWLGASPVRQEILDEIKNRNFTQEMQKKMQFFMLRGGFNYKLCKPLDKLLMNLLKIHLKRIKNPTPDQKGMLASYEHPFDATNIKNITPILEDVKAVLEQVN